MERQVRFFPIELVEGHDVEFFNDVCRDIGAKITNEVSKDGSGLVLIINADSPFRAIETDSDELGIRFEFPSGGGIQIHVSWDGEKCAEGKFLVEVH